MPRSAVPTILARAAFAAVVFGVGVGPAAPQSQPPEATPRPEAPADEAQPGEEQPGDRRSGDAQDEAAAEDADLLGQLEPADLEARLAAALEELRSEDEATWRRAERRARKIFARAVSPSFDLFIARARAALEKKDYAAAREHLEALTTLGPAVAEGWRLFGLLELAEGHSGKALSHFMIAAAREPRNFDTLFQLGLLFQKFESPKQAYAILEKALELHPNFEEAAQARELLRLEVEGRGA